MEGHPTSSLTERICLLIRLGRFHFLAGGVLLFLLGVQTAILDGSELDPVKAIMGYAILFGAHLSVSYTNDFYDREADSHNVATPFSGGSGVLKERPDMARSALVVGIALIIFSLLAAMIFMVAYGFDPILLAIVLAGNLLGWSYTAPPLRLAYNGFGEVSTSISVGILVALFGFYITAQRLTFTFLAIGVPMSLYGIVFILDVQIPDMEADVKGGKRTIVTVIGRRASFVAISVLLGISTMGILLVGLTGDMRLPFSMKVVSIISLVPLSASLLPLVSKDRSRETSSRYATMIMGSVFLMVGLIDAYLLVLLTDPL